jgi:hypothetical protein
MNTLRLSDSSQRDVNGNAIKYEAYREAWTRIKQAQESGFFLEAITIEESIISDRLISYLTRTPEAPDPRDRRGKMLSFSQLIERWQKQLLPNTISSITYTDLTIEIDEWRKSRNDAIHAIVKSEPGQSMDDIEKFLENAKKVAARGEYLAREVCKWDKQVKRKT